MQNRAGKFKFDTARAIHAHNFNHANQIAHNYQFLNISIGHSNTAGMFVFHGFNTAKLPTQPRLLSQSFNVHCLVSRYENKGFVG